MIIVNWNGKEFLDRCLQTVFASNFREDFEVIVVDNCSSDNSVALIREKYPRVIVIANSDNVGFARGNNQAIRESRGAYLLLLNPDTEIEPDALQVMVDFMRGQPDCGMAGCRVLNPDGTLQLASRRAIPSIADAVFKLTGISRLFPYSPRFSRYNLTYLPSDQVSPVDAVSGSFLMARRETVDQIGLLDERFFMYGEDLDWCWRSRQAGYQNYYVPGTSIIHYQGQSSAKRPLRTAYYFYQAMSLFYCKHTAPRWAWPMVRAASLLAFMLSLPKTLWTHKKRRVTLPVPEGRTTNGLSE
ncbi:MAG: glycosyltransferase family 2 protein [Bacillota bacterium]